MEKNIKTCYNCPRNCKCDKILTLGFCRVSTDINISKVMLHFWEEPCISGKNGSGAIFFSGCNLKCVFCQNYEISNNLTGKNYSVNDLVNIFKDLELRGAENINLVIPTPYVDKIIDALKIYKPQIPIVYNCSGYEDINSIKLLNGLVDIYLVDCKYFDNNIAIKYSSANNYFNNSGFCLMINAINDSLNYNHRSNDCESYANNIITQNH